MANRPRFRCNPKSLSIWLVGIRRAGRKTEMALCGTADELLGSVPAGSTITVIRITENSFGQPYILLAATISDDPGYFGERLASARHQLVGAWQTRSMQIKPSAKNTDILGAALLASELF